MKYVIAVLTWLWTGLSFGSKFLPAMISVGLYAGLGASVSALIYGVYLSVSSLYATFSQWGGNISQSIHSMFSNLLSNGWFSIFSYITSLDVPVSFFKDCSEKYFSVLMSGVVGLFLGSVVIVFGIVGVIWVRRRLKYILAGFGTSRS